MEKFKKIAYYTACGLFYSIVLVAILIVSFVMNVYVNKGKTIYEPQTTEYTQKKATSEK